MEGGRREEVREEKREGRDGGREEGIRTGGRDKVRRVEENVRISRT